VLVEGEKVLMLTTSKASRFLRMFSPRRLFSVFVVLTFVLGLSLVDADAQSRRRRRTRRARPVVKRPVITNPTIASPANTQDSSSGDVKIISTADETSSDGAQETDSAQPKKAKTTKTTDPEDMRTTITTLTNQVNRLNDRLSQMQEDDRFLLDMERLTRAEQRAEQLRSQLFDAQSKLADLGSRLEQVEYMLKPENIERSMQGYGNVRPEEAREARKRQLESEKGRLQAQINILETSRTRLEQAITTADNEVDLLRARLNQKRMEQSIQPLEPTPPAPRKP
jgi:chromosome segregation ATPase